MYIQRKLFTSVITTILSPMLALLLVFMTTTACVEDEGGINSESSPLSVSMTTTLNDGNVHYINVRGSNSDEELVGTLRIVSPDGSEEVSDITLPVAIASMASHFQEDQDGNTFVEFEGQKVPVTALSRGDNSFEANMTLATGETMHYEVQGEAPFFVIAISIALAIGFATCLYLVINTMERCDARGGDWEYSFGPGICSGKCTAP